MSSARRSLQLEELEGRYAVCRLDAAAAVPDWAHGELCSITRTADELSIVTLEEGIPGSVEADGDWTVFKLLGRFHFSEIGILQSFAEPLAAVGIGIFVLSTFDTDYLMVKHQVRHKAARVLERAGHTVRLRAVDPSPA